MPSTARGSLNHSRCCIPQFCRIKPAFQPSAAWKPLVRVPQLGNKERLRHSVAQKQRPTSVRVAAEQAAAPAADGPEFNWNLALAMAGCAFEAYNGLEEGGSLPLRQMSPSGTQVTYVDKEFVKGKLAGVLEVTVVAAKGLKRGDWWPGSKSDPYAVLTVDGSSGRTPTVTASLDPRWEYTLFLYVRNLKEQRLWVRVLDEDMGESDDLLGAGARGLSDLEGGSQREVEVSLGRDAGSVALRLQFVPFTDDVLEAAAGSRMGGPVLGSPANALLSSPWRDMKQLLIPAEEAAGVAFDPVAFVESPATDTQAWVFANAAQRKVVVAFRGTEQTKWRDVLTDLSLSPAVLEPEGVNVSNRNAVARGIDAIRNGLAKRGPDLRSVVTEGVQAAISGGQDGGGWVHSGFLQAYLSVRAEVQQLLDTVLAGDDQSWTVYLTGHSMGAALSTLCSYDCAKRASWKGPAPAISHYSYGSPRVGNAAFAREFDGLVPDTWRVVNRADAVTQVPRLMGYCHVGHKVSLTAHGGVAVERNSRSALGEGAAGMDLAAAVVAATLGSSGDSRGGGGRAVFQSREEVERMIEAEVAALNAVLDGSALAEHLEAGYSATLQAAIDSFSRGSAR